MAGRSTERLAVTDENQAAFAALLEGLGLDERGIQDAPSKEDRVQIGVELYQSERTALDDAAIVLGVSTRSGARLARAIIRSWLVHAWNHPPELADFDLGDDEHGWADSLEEIRSEAKWPEGAANPAPVFATLIGRLDRGDLLSVAIALVAQMGDQDREALRVALSANHRYQAANVPPMLAADDDKPAKKRRK